jgi:tetratricopeptide (TPR) repeat protein
LQKADPDAPDLYHFAGEARRLRTVAGDAEDARADYEAALRIDPAYAPAWHGLGLLERSVGNHDAARAAFRTYLNLNPEAPDAAFLQAYLAPNS